MGDTTLASYTRDFTTKRAYIPRTMTGSTMGITSRYVKLDNQLDLNMNQQMVPTDQVKPRGRSASALVIREPIREIIEDVKPDMIEHSSLQTAPRIPLPAHHQTNKNNQRDDEAAALRPVPKPRSRSLLVTSETDYSQLARNITTSTEPEFQPTPAARTNRGRSSSACVAITNDIISSHNTKPPIPRPRNIASRIKAPSIEISDMSSPEEPEEITSNCHPISKSRFCTKRNSDTTDRQFMRPMISRILENQLQERGRSQSLNSMPLHGILKIPSMNSVISDTTSDIQYNRPRSHSKVRFEEVVKDHVNTKKDICYNDENTDPKKKKKLVTDPWAMMSMSVKPAHNDSKEINKIRQQRAKQMSASLKDLRQRSASCDRTSRSGKGKVGDKRLARFSSDEELNKKSGRHILNFKLNGGILSSFKFHNSNKKPTEV